MDGPPPNLRSLSVNYVSTCAYRGRSLDQVLQLGVAELQGDDVVQLVPLCVGRLVVAPPLGHGHLCALLRADVHHVHHASAPWRGRGRGLGITALTGRFLTTLDVGRRHTVALLFQNSK